MKYRPLANHVLISMKILTKTFEPDGVIQRPDSCAEMPQEGRIVATGTGCALDVGTMVLIPWATGREVHINGRYNRQVKESDVLAIVEAA